MKTSKSMRAGIYLALLLLISCKSSILTEQEENWIPLFNGKDLTDWNIKINGYPLGENYNSTFRVADGKIIVSYDEYEEFNGEFGHLFYKKPFSYYRLRIEYRIVGEQTPGGPEWAFKNSGVLFHSQSPETMLLEQEFPVSIEAQFLGGAEEGDRPTANLCTPGTHVIMNGELHTVHCTNSSSKTFRGEEWISIELVVLGDSIIHHLVEGETVLTYSLPQVGGKTPEGYPLPEGTIISQGYIALQAESHGYEFRKVELLDLSGQYE
jgi:hypothetical protein